MTNKITKIEIVNDLLFEAMAMKNLDGLIISAEANPERETVTFLLTGNDTRIGGTNHKPMEELMAEKEKTKEIPDGEVSILDGADC